MNRREDLPYHVPRGRGPYVPGCCDVMTDYTKTGLFLRLYYPTESDLTVNQQAKRWIPWLADESYLLGISNLLKLWVFIVRLVMWLISGTLHVPVAYGARVKSDITLKCIVLSHGLGGNRFLYSTTCIDLASNGFLVVAIEHRDKSACRTYYYKSKHDVQADKKTFIEHLLAKFGDSHYRLRNGQVLKRSEECIKTLDFVHDVHKGVIPYNVLVDLPNYTSRVEFELKELTGRVDMDAVTMMGHSFGAATVLVTLAGEPRFCCGVLLDTWMFPVKDDELAGRVTQPLLFVNTQTFHIGSNVRAMQPLLEATPADRQMYTIRATTHESQTDSVFVVGHWLNWFMRKLDAELAIRINCALILRFLDQHVRAPDPATHYYQQLLHKEADHFYAGLTTPWA